MKTRLGTRAGTWLALAAAVLAPVAAPAQDQAGRYPDRMIKLIVPYTPGGLVDTFSRALAEDMASRLGQPVVVENRPGANQAIGANAAARAAPDGYTLFVSSQTGMILNPLTTKGLLVDPAKDFTPIATMFSTPFYLVVNSSVPVKSVQELVALAKSKPGKLTYGSLGRGGTHHLAGEMFTRRTGTNILHVPYKGSAPAMNDLLGGQIDMMFEGGTSTLPYVQSGRLRALASTGQTRSEAMPDLPALNEIIPGFSMTVWIGLVAPSGIPQPIADKLNAAVQAMLKLPSTHEKFAPVGIEMMPGSQADFARLIQSDLPTWAKIVQDAGIEPQ
ncbi:tripartite tricarboxylate transporter substrate binding protein [Pigmentiphaga sp. GD03639]|uniref:Bug family tripartite tricarboxylate transporter substrate binding protein n=1 Tax=Pigmentiphaga sp. GD03639 TaxID=2975354 RepID=UPI00244CF4DC|nr:tripartite tricarboxylate transporter substrate binding protein [Pigmentiphaga sp. GD03639]MDH2239646.1 tripartite tricarboxylate transporter substrate binding protein [Pigmentiphaga sp. GD03639]